MHLLMTASGTGAFWLCSSESVDSCAMARSPSYVLDMMVLPLWIVILRSPGRIVRDISSRRWSAARIGLLLMRENEVHTCDVIGPLDRDVIWKRLRSIDKHHHCEFDGVVDDGSLT